jgi:hypothetical protein
MYSRFVKISDSIPKLYKLDSIPDNGRHEDRAGEFMLLYEGVVEFSEKFIVLGFSQ